MTMSGKSRNPRLKFFVLLTLFLLTLCQTATAQTVSQNATPSIELNQNVKWRWGDSPRDAGKLPQWVGAATDSAGWTNLGSGGWIANNEKDHYVWLTVKLPPAAWSDPALSLRTVADFIEIYSQDALVYRYDNRLHSDLNYTGYPAHIVSIPYKCADGNLYVRLYFNQYRDASPTGAMLFGSEHEMLSGIRKDILDFVKGELDLVILCGILIFTGFGLLVIAFFTKRERVTLLSLAFSCALMGIWLFVESHLGYLFINADYIWFYTSWITIQLVPIGCLVFVESVFGVKNKWLFRALRTIFLIWLMLSLFLDLLNIVSLRVTGYIFLFFFAAAITIITVRVVVVVRQGNNEAKAYAAGLIILFVCALLDITDMFFIPLNILKNHHLTQWGMFIFIMALLYILGMRFMNMHKKLQEAMAQVSSWNKELERKVADRTQEIECANEELTAMNEELIATMDELRRTQVQLVQIEKTAALGNLVAGIAHEINTPLAIIKSNVDLETLLLKDIACSGNEPLESFAANAVPMNRMNGEAAVRISGIVDKLKSFARLDEADVKEVSLHECLDSAVELAVEPYGGKVEIIREYHDIPNMICSPRLLNQVFYNILVNAVESMKDNAGRITIKTRCDSGKVYISISDNGCGIQPQNMGRIFDPGYTTKGAGVGTGLGLSIAWSVIMQHKGKIAVESSPDEGSTFTIELPAQILR